MSEILNKSPYQESYGKYVQKHYFAHPTNTPIRFDDSRQITKNLTLGELRKSSFVTQEEKNLFAYIPIDNRVIKAFQILRDVLGKPITVTSSFRSYRWEIHKGRSGDSQHFYAKALDLKGVGLVELLKTALEEKNELYKRLRAAGVNAFGIYEKDGFIHIDVRDAKVGGGYYFWTGSEDSELKKKSMSISTTVVLGIIGVVLSAVGLFFKFKDRK
ncbi:D-Ala-D-Ala carboxypeptidase family metallohydrolase [Tenacibaculum ovolyticum]|uniref:D-Ala-D-Ala carboxypeptidase family metallohydrolase n=1 Tax=Tenacibaculum ovolyticum TaxID=104270 RepID=UPI0004136F91|nr:D-Ala-D-Ala carboxypeptidase family metallohydrolase [Tenacibaculum ovolyticum]